MEETIEQYLDINWKNFENFSIKYSTLKEGSKFWMRRKWEKLNDNK